MPRAGLLRDHVERVGLTQNRVGREVGNLPDRGGDRQERLLVDRNLELAAAVRRTAVYRPSEIGAGGDRISLAVFARVVGQVLGIPVRELHGRDGGGAQVSGGRARAWDGVGLPQLGGRKVPVGGLIERMASRARLVAASRDRDQPLQNGRQPRQRLGSPQPWRTLPGTAEKRLQLLRRAAGGHARLRTAHHLQAEALDGVGDLSGPCQATQRLMPAGLADLRGEAAAAAGKGVQPADVTGGKRENHRLRAERAGPGQVRRAGRPAGGGARGHQGAGEDGGEKRPDDDGALHSDSRAGADGGAVSASSPECVELTTLPGGVA